MPNSLAVPGKKSEIFLGFNSAAMIISSTFPVLIFHLSYNCLLKLPHFDHVIYNYVIWKQVNQYLYHFPISINGITRTLNFCSYPSFTLSNPLDFLTIYLPYKLFFGHLVYFLLWQNAYNIKFTLLTISKYTVTLLCNYHHHLFPFHYPKLKLYID